MRNMAPAYTQLPIAATPPAPVPQSPPLAAPSLTVPQLPPLAAPNPTQFPAIIPDVSQSNIPGAFPAPSFFRARVAPLPQTIHVKVRTGDISKYYSTPGSSYTGRVSHRHSLARHQGVFYAQAHICDLNAQEALQGLIMMIELHALAGTFQCSETFQKVAT